MIWTRLFIGLLATGAFAGCAIEESSASTLPPLADTLGDAPPPLTTDDRVDPWAASFSAPVREHRAAIASVRDALVDERDTARRIVICTAATSIDTPAFNEPHDAPDAQPDWVRAVDLTRWMVASCAAGAVEKVDEILPMLDEALARFDAWWTAQPPTTASKVKG